MLKTRFVLFSPQLVGLMLLSGCVTVDARRDFDRAEQMVTERTGVARICEQEEPSDVEAAVAELLADGLTTDEAIQVALLENSRFRALLQEIGVARAEVVQAGLLTNPSIGLSTRLPEGGGRANLGVSFAQQIADLWQIPARKRIAEAALEQAILDVVHQATLLASDTRRDCYELIALRQLEDVGRESAELADKALKLAKDRFDAGEAGIADVNLARANTLSQQAHMMGLRRDLELARSTLANTLGLARWTEPWTLEDSLPSDAMPVADDDSLVLLAMRERLDARAAALQVHAAEDEVRKQYASIFPNVTIGVEWERTERRSQPRRHILADTARASVANGRLTAPSIQSRAERRQERSQTIDSLLGPTLEITLPLWDQNQAQIAKAQFLAVKARQDYEAILDQVAQDIQQAQTVATSAAELVTFFEKEALPHARLSVETVQRAYRAGTLDILALLDAQKTLVAEQEAYVGAKRDLALALAELRRATGGRLPGEFDDAAPVAQPHEEPDEQPNERKPGPGEENPS